MTVKTQVRPRKGARKIDPEWLLKRPETFDILRKTLESIIASGAHPHADELAAYIGAERQPLSQTVREYIADTIRKPHRRRGRPKTQTVGDNVVREWCRVIYAEEYQLAKRRKLPDAAIVVRDRVAEALNISSATVGRWVAIPKSRIKK